ncbi:hypothetical protein Phum_PHUM512160 [Pediculus humanus corporis]|uniref:Uncharacterized protein n=1 Tax=Pediculus humanus subsp. corporis TaxID=121224 RepID=E0VYA7_PEDHC|nr:uncharacterized protein Phum_PHUM512160 [Pediculus humanus corporis]EEB18363.1 hypothetical protein Phum_PHUM512160 [Pediculus humanus corporis]
MDEHKKKLNYMEKTSGYDDLVGSLGIGTHVPLQFRRLLMQMEVVHFKVPVKIKESRNVRRYDLLSLKWMDLIGGFFF